MSRGESRPEEVPRPNPSYLKLQAYIGTTKHMGGLDATRELAELCTIGEGDYVLDVGCGAGATAAYLVEQYGCRVVGVDISAAMIDLARRRAARDRVADRVTFTVADARDLPFESAMFDAIICESVLTFFEGKQRAVGEFVRVTRPAGYVGLNEETWRMVPPPANVLQFAQRTWDINADIPTADRWAGMLVDAGLHDVVARPHKFSARRESSQIWRYGLEDYAKMAYRTLTAYLRSPEFRRYMHERRSVPKDVFEYLGYGIYVGRK